MRITGLVLALFALPLVQAHGQANPYQPSLAATVALQVATPASAPIPARLYDVDGILARRFSSRAPGATLMIIGGAGIVAGILVGGSGGAVLILGGVGVGAYGLYLYTR